MQGPFSQQEHKAALLDKGFRVGQPPLATSLTQALLLLVRHLYSDLQALQLLNTEYAQAFRSLQLAQLEHQSTQGILHAVGELAMQPSNNSSCKTVPTRTSPTANAPSLQELLL